MPDELDNLIDWLRANPSRLAEVQDLSGVSVHTIAKILNGQTSDPRWSTVKALLKARLGLEHREAA